MLYATIKRVSKPKRTSFLPPGSSGSFATRRGFLDGSLTDKKAFTRFWALDKTSRSVWCCVIIMLFFSLAGCIKHAVEIEDRKAAIHYNDRFYDLAAIDNDKIWIVGFYGKIVHSADGGKTWLIQKSNTKDPLTGVAFVNSSMGWVTTLKGEVLHTSDGGATWILQESGAEGALMDVTFLDKDRGWAVGAYNTILRTEDGGNNWLPCSVPEETIEDATGLFIETGESILNSVSFENPNDGWVVGEYGTVYNTKDGGITWTKKNSGIQPDNYLFDVCFSSPERGWIVAIGGRMFKTDDGAEAWSQCSSPTTNALYGVGCANGQIWATGTRGTLIVHSGEGWSHYMNTLPSFSWFRSIEFFDKDHAWIVGGAGTVLKTTNGGKEWLAMR